MNNAEFDEAIQISLRTWYPKKHELHLNPHHPLGKLLGEWGELLDDYMKGLYKPGYRFEPENELGDIWYYLRILCYQQSIMPEYIEEYTNNNTDYLLSLVIFKATMQFKMLCQGNPEVLKWSSVLDASYSVLLRICDQHNITIEQLTESNWEKLKPGSERGKEWIQAR